MESNKRLYVFDKKEILLVFILVLLISTTCFVYGVKIGKTYTLGVQGISDADIKRVELLSEKEEQALGDEEILEEMVKKAQPQNEGGDAVISNDRLREKIDIEVLGDQSPQPSESLEKKRALRNQTQRL